MFGFAAMRMSRGFFSVSCILLETKRHARATSCVKSTSAVYLMILESTYVRVGVFDREEEVKAMIQILGGCDGFARTTQVVSQIEFG